MKLLLKVFIVLCIICSSVSVFAETEDAYTGSTNYTVGVTVQIANRNGDTGGIHFRMQNDILYDPAYYAAEVVNLRNQVYFRLTKRVRYTYYTLYNRALGAAGTYHIQAEVQDDRIRLFLDDVQEFEFEDCGYLEEQYIGHPLLSGGAEAYCATAEGGTVCSGFYLNEADEEKSSMFENVSLTDDSGEKINRFVPPDTDTISVQADLKQAVNADLILCLYTASGLEGVQIVPLKDESLVSGELLKPSDGQYAYIKAYLWDSVSGMKPLCEAESVAELNRYLHEETETKVVPVTDFSNSSFAYSGCTIYADLGSDSESVSGIALDTGLSDSKLYGRDFYLCAVSGRTVSVYHEYNGKSELLGSEELPKAKNGVYQMEIKLRGADMKISIDGVRYLTCTAKNLFYLNGNVGKYLSGEQAFANNITIR